MCGLVSVINKRSNGFMHEQNQIFASLLFLDTLRGDDSTGAFVVSNIGNVSLAKEASQGPDFITKPEFKTLQSSAFSTGWAAVGHNRKATKGSITDKNAHPFVVDENIVLVHNGTFYGDHKHHADTEVDSEAIAHLLNNANSVESALQKVNAAYALIWYNVSEKALYFIRNSARPLFYMETADSYIWASEFAFLQFVETRHNLKVIDGPHLLKEHCLVKYQLQDSKVGRVSSSDIDSAYRVETPARRVLPANQENESEFAQRVIDSYAGREDCEDSCQTLWDWPNGKHHRKPPLSLVGPTDTKPVTPVVVHNGNVFRKPETAQYIEWKRVQETFLANYKHPRMVKFKDFQDMHAGFGDKQRITVVVNDIVEFGDDPKTNQFIMIGSYVGNNNIYGAFLVKDQEFDSLLKNTNEAIFHMEYERILWNRISGQEEVDNIDNKLGACVIYGKNPTLVSSSTVESIQ